MITDKIYFKTVEDAQAYIDACNSISAYPITGKINGVLAPDNQKSLGWYSKPMSLTDECFSVPMMPNEFMQKWNVKQDEIARIRKAQSKAFFPEPEIVEANKNEPS